jgi:hypothetical protein
LKLAVLAAKQLEFGFELIGPLHGAGMHRLPIPDLLPQFGVLATEPVDLLTEFAHLTTKLSHEVGQLSRLGGRKWGDKRVFHNRRHLYPKSRLRARGQLTRENGIGEGLRVIYTKSCADLLFGELRRVRSSNTTRRYLTTVIKVLADMPSELIEAGFESLAEDKSFSQKMRDKFKAVLRREEDGDEF